jgi:SpoVK/Ycf46/Vps4 family AAA+-type ATPase
MAAHALAGELRLPLIRVRLEVVFSKFLGETAGTLADVFAEAERVRGVYLFDEFDALGRTRLDDSDVGEVKRVVTTFLQLLDADASTSLMVAATNAGQSLDAALFRRFDDVVEFPLPSPEQRAELIQRLLKPWRLKSNAELLSAADGLTYADIRAGYEDAYKDAVLSGADRPTAASITERLLARRTRLR